MGRGNVLSVMQASSGLPSPTDAHGCSAVTGGLAVLSACVRCMCLGS